MPGIEDAIARLEAAGFRFNPGATPAEIQALEAAMGCAPPPEMVALYRHGNGTVPIPYPDRDEAHASGEVFRLMSTEEAADEHATLERCRISISGRRCFWSDDQSNYAALYVEGPLAGRVCLIWHDDPDPSPVYRTVGSFLSAVASAGFTPGEEPSPDYPAPGPLDPGSERADWAAAQALRPAFESAAGQDRIDLAYLIMTLTPYERTETLVPFTEIDDFYIQEKACNILGLRRWEPAIPRLAELAQYGVANAKTAAIRALGRIGAPAALRELVRVHEALPPRQASAEWWFFGQALAACGCEVDRSDVQAPQYREPGAEAWKPLRRE